MGAGLPVLSTLKHLLETGDRVRKVEGIFSGTLSYIFNTFGDGRCARAPGLGGVVAGRRGCVGVAARPPARHCAAAGRLRGAAARRGCVVGRLAAPRR